jgi:TRAP-type C4-dicarboxylate transport system substrate-binding protein
VNGLAMSRARWNSLSPEQQRIITEVSAEIPAKVGEFEAQFDEASCKIVKDAGAELHVLSEEERRKIDQAGRQRVLDEWKKAVDATGVSADEFYAAYRRELEAAEKEFSDFQTGVQRCASS